MRKRMLVLSALLVAATLSLAFFDDTSLDAVTKQASQLEAQLSKTRSTSPEAADVMLKLIDLYHDSGRVFGLIRVGTSFVSLHTSHPKHKEAMRKLLDGLQVTARNKELVATGRQFLVRYPTDPGCAEIERILADLLARSNDSLGAAAMNEARWKRLGPTLDGRSAGLAAVAQYWAQNNPPGFTKAGTLADEMVEKLPASGPTTSVGWQAVDSWERLNNWAKANQSATKLLAKSPPTNEYYLRTLHHRMAENYSRLGQRANAIDSFKKALAVKGPPRPDLMARLISEAHQSAAKPPEIEPLVAQYYQQFPTREDRFGMRTLVGISYLAAMNKAAAEQIFAEVLPFDARTHGAISYYCQLIPVDPAKAAAAETVIRNAIAKSKPYNAIPLRYHLAFDICRDRLKDINKAKAVAAESLFQFPANENYAGNLALWLLDNAANDAEFQANFNKLLEVRKQKPFWEFHRNIAGSWILANAMKKEATQRVAFAKTALAKADRDPVFADWLALEKATREGNPAAIAAARAKVMGPKHLAEYGDDLADALYYQQQYYYRYQAPGNQQPQSVRIAKAWAKRLPKSEHAANSYLQWTTDFSVAAEYKEAVEHMLTIEPASLNTDICRRMLQAAAQAKDVDLAKKSWAWIQKRYEKFGYDNNGSQSIGDYLEGLGLKQEALDCWKRALTGNPDVHDFRTALDRLLSRTTAEPDKAKLIDDALKADSYWHFNVAMLKADRLLKAGDIDGFDKLLRAAYEKQRERAFGGTNFENEWTLGVSWVTGLRADMKATDAVKRRVFTLLRDLRIRRPSMVAAAALLELPEEGKPAIMKRLLALSEVATYSYGDPTDWDLMLTFAQNAMTKKDYGTASTLFGGMLGHCLSIDEGRRKVGREMLTQAYSRLGAAGAAIDDKSPIAPLLQAALHLRLGDNKLAFDTYLANQKLFDAHRHEVPVDLLLFVCDSHMAAGGEDNANRVEDILRVWLVKNSESKEIDESEKARVQLLLARNYFRGKRYDLARAEFTTVLNRYAKTPQAVEAEFGIGETFMEQKVYDQAEQTFERLAGSRERDIAIRAEFLRGVLASRRGERDEARLIFRRVLERVPTIEVANQVLYNLSEVYGAEQRYVEQLELLRTVGRLGRNSKRYHTPGETLSIVVQDSDLGVSRGHARIPVRVITEPGGDEEIIYLRSGGAGKGLFRADLETRLGNAAKNDRVLQLTGKDIIRCDYPDDFKKEFSNVPLPDAEIRIAADAKFEISSSKIVDQEEENFSKKLAREGTEDDDDKRKSTGRPTNQIKPGNLVYLRVQDADRDLSDKPDPITVKLTAASGDQVQVTLLETGPHTGTFEGTAKTGELPAGALATNSAIDHSALMAIDKDKKTYWLSEPDGVTPKVLTIDMKDLKRVDRAVFSTLDPMQQSPVRGTLEGSNDGRMWFKLAANPVDVPVPPLPGEYARMSARVYEGTNGAAFNNWTQVIDLFKNGKPTAQTDADQLAWTRADETKKVPVTTIWHGRLVQPRPGAARIGVKGDVTALMLDGQLLLPVAPGTRSVDVFLDAGSHELAIFSAAGPNTNALEVLWARSDHHENVIALGPFREKDFDLNQPEAKPAPSRKPGQVGVTGGDWDFRFTPVDLRYVRLVIHEYRGEAVAINHVEIMDSEKDKVHIPTTADILSLANNDILEIAGGDVVTASYIDENNTTGSPKLLTAHLTATYHNATIVPINYDFVKAPNGAVLNVRKQMLRINPGDRFIVEVTDYDQDRTAKRDEIKIEVSVNNSRPVELTATETLDNSGIFTKEVDTTAKSEEGKLLVKVGDRIYCRYLDEQNTIPGHAVPRETVVYVNEPTDGRLRIIETRATPSKEERGQAHVSYLPQDKAKKTAAVAFDAPFTVEVIDRDAAKDSRSTVTVTLTTTDGSKVDVECILSDATFLVQSLVQRPTALEEGRFTGQVILQLGGKDSPTVVPLGSNMPRNIVGGPKIVKDENATAGDNALITHVLNITGKDIIEATYVDAQRPKAGETKLTAQARMITDGKLSCTDSEYQKDMIGLHVGERLYLKVVDADLDTTGERDVAKVVVTSKRGEKETIELLETAAHSGIFTGSVMLKPEEKPTPGNFRPEAAALECWFGDDLDILYVDQMAGTANGTLECRLSVKVVIGTDGKVSAFSKRFSDEALAVETQFHVAESHFELFKSHKALNREDEARADLESGRRVLREVMEDYPNPKYTPRVAYLLGQFSQELKQYGEAIESYQLIVRLYPDHVLAADAQFKLAQCYEEAGEFNQALEAYVTLAATYPKNPLIANVMLRISEHFYKSENYKVAAQVGEKFLERFEGHKWGSKMAFRVGQCYYKDKQYVKAATAFDNFVKAFRDDPLGSDAMFWAGESYRTAGNMKKAFESYNKCRWDFPSSEAAKYARGRLALPEMLQQFEAASNLDK